MYRTKDQVASEFIAEGKRRNITGRGIVICIATGLVESSLTVYANSKVPASLVLPHDAVGSDGFSCGPLQQQVVNSGNGWWWGDAATCMDPTRSCGLFYDRLVKLNYNGPNSPGSYAQAIQQSAFPDRYDQQMGAAQAIYDRLSTGGIPVVTDPNRPDFNEYGNYSTNNQDRGGTKVDLFLLHTNEGDNNADSLAKFLISTQGGANPVSYHYTISEDANDHGVTVVDVVDTDLASWSVGNSNDRTINLCFAGSYAAWTRDQWLAKASKAIDVAAYLAVQDCRKYNIPLKVIVPYSAPGGVADHRYCTNYLKDGNNHTDMGGPLQPPWTGFPWDTFTAAFNKHAGIGVPPPVVTPPVVVPPVVIPVGPADDQLTLRWNCLGGHTMVEAMAQIRDKTCGTNDAAKTGVA